MYVSLIYSKGGTTHWLKDHPSKTLLHMITPSDIAYVVALLKNSQTAWTVTPVDEQKKALFTSGDKKRGSLEQPIGMRKALVTTIRVYLFGQQHLRIKICGNNY